MNTVYELSAHGKAVGRVEVVKSGLYYSFRCVCDEDCRGICRISVVCDGKRENLGVCVPEDGKLMLRCKLPVKRFSGDDLRFELIDGKAEYAFVPIDPEKPFPYIEKLGAARFCRKNGQTGLELPMESLRDTGTR